MTIDVLKQPYSEEQFLEITRLLIGSEFSPSDLSIKAENSASITGTKYFGEYGDLGLHILAIEHSSKKDARVSISLDIFRLMKRYSFQNALVAAYSDKTSSWRYSLITSNLSLGDKGKVLKEFSNPRRFSFLLGPGQKVLTPFKQLLLAGEVTDIAALMKRFSLEVVNNEFYREIARLYEELVGTDKIARKLKYPNTGDESHEFAVRLIGRIIFCWFLREKKSTADLALIPTKILSRKAAEQQNYYHGVLAPLFFEVLNKPIEKRTSKFQVNEYKDIPYLNGGLFSSDSIDYYKFDRDLETSIAGIVDIPDIWLQELFDLLERFNFTVDENTSYDTDLSIDPEMLGRVFENLLARINPDTGETVRKSTGSFYTPREIVEYMVDVSITEYLYSKTKIGIVRLEALVSYDLFDDISNELSLDEKILVLQALSTLTVLDPACGSGAFPIGMLQKIVFIISQIDPKAEWWLAKQLEGASPELRREFANRSVDYIRKLGIIRQTIFGVDIQPIATEISRLRCFLTLIVDEEIDDNNPNNRGIRPLPNLDFKFVTANSLINLAAPADNRIQMFEDHEGLNELAEIMSDYFTAPSIERDAIKYHFTQVQKKMTENMLKQKDVSAGTKTFKVTSWDPFEHKPSKWFDSKWMFGIDQFDIIIANPPYLGEKSHKELFREIKKDGLEEFYLGKMDLFYFFFHHALNLSKDNGIIAFITTNYYPTASGAYKLRKDLYERARIVELINFNELKIFESALGQHNMISVLQKTVSSNPTRITVANITGLATADMLVRILNKQSFDASFSITSKDDLFDKDDYQIRFTGDLTGNTSAIDQLINKIKNGSSSLGSICNINQGLLSGADTLTKKHLKTHGELAKEGAGIFVLDINNAEDKDLIDSLSANEEDLLKPFFKNSNINKYVCDETPTKFVLYISRKVDIEILPNVKAHLTKFKPILTKRLETYGESYHWNSLHREREKKIFEAAKIMVPYRSKYNNFGYTEKPWYFRTDAYSIIPRNSAYPIKYLLGLLNSKLVFFWLYNRGKRKGDTLELFYEPLSKIPIKGASDHAQAEVTVIVDQILEAKQNDKNIDTGDLEKRIDQLVYKLYDLTRNEIEVVERAAQ